MMIDDYVEVMEVVPPEPSHAQRWRRPPAVEVDVEFAARMENWRRTLRGGAGHGGGYCAAWARLFVQARMAREQAVHHIVGLPPLPSRVVRDDDELDGWLVEAAVRQLSVFNERKVLQYHYVLQYSDRRIRTQLKLRDGGLRLLMGRARGNLKNILRKLDTAANILVNN